MKLIEHSVLHLSDRKSNVDAWLLFVAAICCTQRRIPHDAIGSVHGTRAVSGDAVFDLVVETSSVSRV